MARTSYILIITLVFLLVTCSGYGTLKRVKTPDPSTIKGSFTLYLLQDEPGADAARAAIIDVEGDDIRLVPAVSSFYIKTHGGLTLSSAMDKSQSVFASHCAYTGHVLRGLASAGGEIVGYEITPVYTPFLCEFAPTVNLNYYSKGQGIIRVVMSVTGKVEDTPLRIHLKDTPPK